jgi:glutamine amidotransferase/cyclase
MGIWWVKFFTSTELKNFKVEHFSEVFEETDVEAALAAGIFHREEVPIEAVKDHMREKGIETR